MPDHSDQRVPGEVFKQKVATLAGRPHVRGKGGILSLDHYKSYIVNIRPTKWKSQKFWIGQIDDYTNAQFIADAVFYYIGHPSVHLTNNASFKFPPLECPGTSTPLTSREMCFQYATSIAKGREFKAQRLAFRESVKRLALEELKSVRVQKVLQQFRGSALVDKEEEEEEVVQADQPDDPKHLPGLILSSNAHVPGFDMSESGFHLQSNLTPIESSWVEAYLNTLGENQHESSNHDEEEEEEEFCSATKALEKNSFDDCPSAFENFRVNFFAMED